MATHLSDISLRGLNSFHVDVRARDLYEFSCREDLQELITSNPDILAGDWYLLGGGNNTLFTKDFNGVIIHPVSKGICELGRSADRVSVRVQAGEEWDNVVEWCVSRGLWGIENLSGIPGQAGAAPVQNIGAYGADVSGAVESVECVDASTGKTVVISAPYCSFGYRESIFKGSLRGRVIITSVVLSLSTVPKPLLDYGALRERVSQLGEASAANIRRAVTEIRASKLPDPALIGNAGSFFKNPTVDSRTADSLRQRWPDMPSWPQPDGSVKLAAGWLIEKAGWKGRALGRAAVHDRQALVLTNRSGDATGKDIIALADAIREDVGKLFSVDIVPEVNIL